MVSSRRNLPPTCSKSSAERDQWTDAGYLDDQHEHDADEIGAMARDGRDFSRCASSSLGSFSPPSQNHRNAGYLPRMPRPAFVRQDLRSQSIRFERFPQLAHFVHALRDHRKLPRAVCDSCRAGELSSDSSAQSLRNGRLS